MKAIISWLIMLLTLSTASADTAGVSEQPVRFAIIGDRTGGHEPGIWGAVLAEAGRLNPEFMITVGDMIEGYTEDSVVLAREWAEVAELVSPVEVPIYFTPGNHDLTTPGQLSAYRANVGEPYYSFDHRGVHIVVIDNSANAGGPVVPIPDEQYDWLVQDLTDNAAAAHTLVFCHKPFFFSSLGLGKPHRLHDLFVDQGVDAVFCGHFHRYFATEYDGIKYTAIGSSGGDMTEHPGELGYHFAWVTIDDEGVHIAPIAASAVYAWDNFSVDDLLMANGIERRALTMAAPIMVAADLSVPSTEVAIRVENIHKTATAEDTLTWSIPEGWTVEPAQAPFSLPPGAVETLTFAVSAEGGLYPSPSVSASFPLRGENDCLAARDLWIARRADCHPVADNVSIDGRLVEKSWIRPETRLFSPDGGETAVDPVEFFFAYDDANLYLAARCIETRPDSLWAEVTERDGAVYGEDCIGFFFAPDPVGDTIYQLYLNPLGTVFDQLISWTDIDWYETDRDWDANIEVAAVRSDTGWTIEARIPLADLGSTGLTDEGWGVNFRRKQKRLNTSGDWLVPIDYAPDTYGRLKFLKDQ